MPRLGIPIPLISRTATLPSELPTEGQPLPWLYAEFLGTAFAGAEKSSSFRNHRRTRDLASGLPPHPTPRDVERWRADIARHYGSMHTVQHHCDNLGRMFEWANAHRLVQGNPVRANRFRPPRRTPKAIPNIRAYWPRILAAMPCDRSRLFVGVQRFAGLREGEALALLPEDVLPSGRDLYLSVTKQRPRNGESWETVDLKTGERSHRQLPVRPELRPLLTRVLGLGPAEVWIGRGGQRRELVPFLCPFRPHELEAFAGALELALPSLFTSGRRWHVLRHSFAKELGDAGRSAPDVQPLLGHAHSETTTHYMSRECGQRVGKEVFAGLDPVPKKKARVPAQPGTRAGPPKSKF